MKRLALIIFIGVGIPAVAQVELKEGVHYEESTQLFFPASGITFKIPPGWSGGVPAGSPAMVLTHASNEATILVTSYELEAEYILDEMSKEIPLEQGISLVPSSPAQRQVNKWHGEYQVQGVQQPMKGYVEIRLGNFGIGAGCVVLTLPESFERGKSGAIALLSSIVFSQPVQSQNAKTTGINQPWNEYLKGRSLKFYYTQGDYSESDFIHLCSNGSFQRSKRTSSGGINGYGAISDSNQGSWLATGEGDSGKLMLNNQDGTRSEFQIQFGQGKKGLGLYLNGSRYYEETSTQCN